jgi:hypothetical protein
MRYRVTLLVEVEADSLVNAANNAEAPVLTEAKRQPTRLSGIVTAEAVEVEKVR